MENVTEKSCSGPMNEHMKNSLKTLRALQTKINKKKGTLAEDEKEPKKEMKWRRSKTTLEERVRGVIERRLCQLLSSSSAPIRAKLLSIPLNPPSDFNHQSGDLVAPSGQSASPPIDPSGCFLLLWVLEFCPAK